jgi:hypothetical protein
MVAGFPVGTWAVEEMSEGFFDHRVSGAKRLLGNLLIEFHNETDRQDRSELAKPAG